jgi:hypothetical protein
MGDPRSATLQVSRPIQLLPFSSASTSAQDTKVPDFEFAMARDGQFILLPEARWPTRRFVYIFLDKALVETGTWRAAVIEATTGAGVSGNPLFAVVRVEPGGELAICSGRNYKDGITSGTVPFEPGTTFEHSALEPEALREETAGSYAVAAPILLTVAAIAKLEERRPRGIPILGTGMGIGVPAPVENAPKNPVWVFPVVEPILIAGQLTRKFYEAADNFLSAAQQIDRPAARNDEERKARNQGEILRLKKTVADNLIGLKSAAPSLADTFEDTMQSGFPEAFVSEYRESLNELVFQRELAAFQLIAWLESDLFVLADDWWERKEDKPDADYELYVKAVLEGLARLAESDRGVQYLMDVRKRLEAGSSFPEPGVLHVVNDFVFRSTQSTSEQQVLALKMSVTLFGVWSGFVAAALAVRQRVVKGPNPTTTLVEDMKAFADRLRFTFHDGFLTVEVDDIRVESAPQGTLSSVVDVPTPSFGPIKAALAKVKLPTEHVTRVCAVLNFGLAAAALRTALDESGDARAKNMALSDLAGASLGVLDQAAALPLARVEAFRSRLAGKVNMGGAMLGNRVAGTLGLLGAVASLTSASLATAEEFDRGDWDEAMAHMTEGIGALITGAGATVILYSGTTGPFALWAIGIGTAISAAGLLWSIFAADSEIDQMLKFSAFGKQSGQAASKPPGWSQCKTSFAEWNPNTPAGLVLQLQAFQQIFYSFEASGASPVAPGPLASDGILRITPASLKLTSSFEIEYSAVYAALGAGAGPPTTRNGKARVSIPSTADKTPLFVDDGNNYQTAGAIRVHKDGGRDAIDVRFRLIVPLATTDGRPLELESLSCRLQLRVPGMKTTTGGGDDALVVPTTAKGAQVVKVVVQEGHKVRTEPSLSVKV